MIKSMVAPRSGAYPRFTAAHIGTLATAFAAALAASLATAPAAAAITYTSPSTAVGSTGSYTLSVTTNGTLGALASTDIVSFLIGITDSHGTLTITNANAGFGYAGGLSASATGLFFDFSGNGYAVFQSPGVSKGGNFLCFDALSPITCGFNFGAANLLVGGENAETSTSARQGVTLIAAVAAVPEPASWAMMLLGFGAIGLTIRRRRLAT